MAVYKVPQDVEADDKLIGPFSFRQFIYLIIVVLAGAGAWGLSRLFLPLVVIPLPLIIFFGALALPLRKDQPMEIYLAAMLSFLLKPHRRLWDADGIDSLIEITVPKLVEIQRTKDISRNEAEQRFGYLADLVDSQGWAVRGMGVQAPNSAMNSDAYFSAQQTQDVLDDSTLIAQDFDQRLEENDVKHRRDLMAQMHNPVTNPTQQPLTQPTSVPIINPYTNFGTSIQQDISAVPTPIDASNVNPAFSKPLYNPYPDIQQAVIQPLGAAPLKNPVSAPVKSSEKPISPDIINLATNTDLSIETIAREANRIQEKEDMSEEVIISLR